MRRLFPDLHGRLSKASPHELIYPVLIVLSQLADSLAYVLVHETGRELNFWMSPLSPQLLVTIKVCAGVVVALGVWTVRQRHPRLAPVLATAGFFGCLSGLVVLL